MIDQTLEVYAAASLKEAFTKVAHAFEAAHPGVTVHLQFAGSQTLAAQISNGAPADVFASADARNLDRIAYDPTTRRVFATNDLVVAAPRRLELKSLAGIGKIVIAAPAVPVGGYTQTALDRASKVYGGAWLQAIKAHVVSEEADVRSVLAKVKLGEADAGIVYASDVVSAGKGLRATRLPGGFTPPIEYPAAVPKNAPEPRLARAFVEFLTSRAGRRALAAQGFGAP